MRFAQRATGLTNLKVSHGADRFDVAVRVNPRASRLRLRVSPTGELRMTVPSGDYVGRAHDFAQAQSAWIARQVAGLPAPARLEPGGVVNLRGIPHTVVHLRKGSGPTVARDDRVLGPVLVVNGPHASLRRRLLDYLVRQAEQDLHAAVAVHASSLGVRVRTLTVRDTVSRWGSCSAKGNLNFSWRLVMAPAFVLDYLAAHEVAHLRELNHSDRFWTLVRGLCPRTDEAEAWLDANGHVLHAVV